MRLACIRKTIKFVAWLCIVLVSSGRDDRALFPGSETVTIATQLPLKVGRLI